MRFSRTSGALCVMVMKGPVVAPPATFFCPLGTWNASLVNAHNGAPPATFFCPLGTWSASLVDAYYEAQSASFL